MAIKKSLYNPQYKSLDVFLAKPSPMKQRAVAQNTTQLKFEPLVMDDHPW